MALNDVYEFQLLGRQNLQRTRQISHWKVIIHTGADDADPSAIGAAILLNFQADFQACTSVLHAIEGFRVTKIRPTLGDPEESGITPLPGLIVGEAMPPNVAAVISLRSGFGGRSNRGRKYVPGVPESYGDNGVGTVAYQALVQGYADQFLSSVAVATPSGSETFRCGVWSKLLLTHQTYQTAIVRPNLGSTNSRKIGRGE